MMKTAVIPFVCVEPAFRAEVEAVPEGNEPLSEFVEASVEAVRQWPNRAEFIARGMASLTRAKESGVYFDADVVVGNLRRKLEVVRACATSAGR